MLTELSPEDGDDGRDVHGPALVLLASVLESAGDRVFAAGELDGNVEGVSVCGRTQWRILSVFGLRWLIGLLHERRAIQTGATNDTALTLCHDGDLCRRSAEVAGRGGGRGHADLTTRCGAICPIINSVCVMIRESASPKPSLNLAAQTIELGKDNRFCNTSN